MGEAFAPQGSEEWRQQRLGKITCSRLKDAMTNARGGKEIGQTAISYLWDLAAEILTGSPQDEVNTYAIEWGNKNEPQARAMYCFRHDVRVVPSGFVQHPDLPGVGGSPDGIVRGDPDGPGGVEIKCPQRSRIHLRYLYDGGVPKDYHMQVQGLMWVCQCDWWDFCSFDPRMPDHLKLFIHRERADKELHEEFSIRCKRLLEQLEIKVNKLRSTE